MPQDFKIGDRVIYIGLNTPIINRGRKGKIVGDRDNPYVLDNGVPIYPYAGQEYLLLQDWTEADNHKKIKVIPLAHVLKSEIRKEDNVRD